MSFLKQLSSNYSTNANNIFSSNNSQMQKEKDSNLNQVSEMSHKD